MATPTTLPAAFVSGDVLLASQLNDLRGAFRVLQVVSTAKTDTFTGTFTTTFADVTGLSVTITPSATTSKVLILASINFMSLEGRQAFRIVRDSTAIAIGNAAGSRSRATQSNANGISMPYNATFLDSPTTTSATTYKIQLSHSNTGAGTTIWVNRNDNDTDNAAHYRSISTITVMEISA
jgi:hypothetical protein